MTKNDIEKMKRQNAIMDFVEAEKVHTHTEIVDRLEELGIYCGQSTISNLLPILGIVKDSEDQTYKVSRETTHKKHVNALETMIEGKQPTYYPNVSCCALTMEEGKASDYAFHLQKAFPGVIIDVTIKVDSLVMLVNMDADTKAFFTLLEKAKVTM